MRQSTAIEKEARERFLAQFGASKIGITTSDGSLTCLHSDLVKIPFWNPKRERKLPEIVPRSRNHKSVVEYKNLGPTRIPRLLSRQSDKSFDSTPNNDIFHHCDMINESISYAGSISALEHNVVPEAAEMEEINRQDSVQKRFIAAIDKNSEWGPEMLAELSMIVEGIISNDKITFYPRAHDPQYDFNLKRYDNQSRERKPPTIPALKLPTSTSLSALPKAIKPQPPNRPKPVLPKRKQLSYSEMLNLPRPPIIPRSIATPRKRPQSVYSTKDTPRHHEIETQTDMEYDLISNETPPISFEGWKSRPNPITYPHDQTLPPPQSFGRQASIVSSRYQSEYTRQASTNPSRKSRPPKPAFFPPIVKLGGLGPRMDNTSYAEGVNGFDLIISMSEKCDKRCTVRGYDNFNQGLRQDW